MHEIPQNLKLVILDCDGVLFDSFRSNVAFYNTIMERMEEGKLSPRAEELCHVLSTPQLFQHLYKDDPERYKRAMDAARQIDYLPFLEYMDPEPGLFQVLEALAERYRLALATNRGKSADPLLKRFGLLKTFETVSTILHVANPKPAPDVLLYCLEKTGVSPDKAVYVGDMENDRVAAEAAGIPFILKGDAVSHPLKIQQLEELPALLRETCEPSI
jgi:HAD superfamily hydrolase (TIGR01509 family)